MDISAIVLTHNNRDRIKDCLSGLDFCDEIIVIDDNSQDLTLSLVKSSKVYQRKLDDDWSSQRNFGLSKATKKWALFVDSDEKINIELEKEIPMAIGMTKYDGFYIRRRDYFFGKYLRFGETGNIKLLRLGKNGAGGWVRKVHEYWNIKNCGTLKNPLLHYPHKNLNNFILKINLYSGIDAGEMGNFKITDMFIKPCGKFLLNYIFRLGFLDGFAGFVHAYMMSLQSLVVRIKQYEKAALRVYKI